MANHQKLKVTPEFSKRIELFLSDMDDSLKLQLCSFVLENLEEFRRGCATKTYSHCPIPASIEERRVVGGQLQFSEDGQEVDCTKTQGRKIIPNVDKVRVDDMKSSSGKFILVVQRYEIYRRLAVPANDSDVGHVFYESHPCIVVNVEEELDSVTKLFLCKLKMELKLPMLALVDSSPDGVKIISTVSQCCRCDVNWLGMLPSELDKGMFAIANDPMIRIPMTDSDLKTLEDLMENDDFVKEKMRNPKCLEEPALMENDDLIEKVKNLELSNLMGNDFSKENRKNPTWFEELTLMKKTKTKTKVEDFDDFMSMLFSMLIVAFERSNARGDQE
ncbi:DNA topoisomerase 6 subunit A-like [Rosa sericea]